MILAATGLQRERRIVEGPGVRAIAGGGDGAALEAALERLAPQADGLISIGIAGGLAPDLAVGAWVVGDAVLFEDRRWPTHAAWSARLAETLAARRGPVLGSSKIVADSVEKQRLQRQTGALAVDMESQVVARVAARHGRPFAVARVVSDAAGHSLPPAARVAMGADGGVAVGPLLRSLLRHPGQVPALVRLGRNAERAFTELLRGHRRLGPRLAFPDLGELALDVP